MSDLRVSDLDNLPLTLGADDVAAVLGCSTWTLYELVKRDECPVAPLRLGRKLRWPTAAVLRVVGLPADLSVQSERENGVPPQGRRSEVPTTPASKQEKSDGSYP